MHKAGRVHCRCSQCFPVKGYEKFVSVLATTVRLILKLDICPEIQWANTPYRHSLVIEPPEVCSPPCLRHLSQNKINYLVGLPVSFHCLERQPLRYHKSQMPIFKGWMRCIWSSESEWCWKVTLCDDATASTTVKLGDFKDLSNPIVTLEVTPKGWVPRP